MARNQVMKLWTAIVAAFLALCTTLGLVTAASAAAVPETGTARNCGTDTAAPAMSHGAWPLARSLPPTMKQRIRAEAHGSSPSCRHRPPANDSATDPAALHALTAPADPETPLQR